ncbi:hypothetical protein GIB67_016128, partial [Kingdonia uniflora]
EVFNEVEVLDEMVVVSSVLEKGVNPKFEFIVGVVKYIGLIMSVIVCRAFVVERRRGFVKEKVQLPERGEFSACTTLIGFDLRDPFDMGGPRMFNNTHQDMILRRKLEEAELQQALELQSRRLMGLQLLDIKKLHHHQNNMSSGSSPICSPHSPHMNHNLIVPPSSLSDRSSHDSPSP